MKRIYSVMTLLFIFVIAVSACTPQQNDGDITVQSTDENVSEIISLSDTPKDEKELIGVWCNYYELSMKESKGGTGEQFREKVKEMFTVSQKAGINTVFVQVRPFCDAFYKSELFPWSEYITGEQGKDPGYDPLEIMTQEARKLNLQIHGWINPYRVSYKTDINTLSENNPARKMYKEDPDSVYVSDSGIFLNPASEKAKKLVIDGVKELLNYDIDGIHMDDYFYPGNDEKIDKKDYEEYKKSGGNLTLAQWRRNQVSALVGMIYSQIKSENDKMMFGISPMGDIEKNYNSIYADLELWCTKGGYVDYIMPQLYYGFENKTLPFEKTAKDWNDLVSKGGKVKLYAGLALYKCGLEDKYAGAESDKKDTGRYEWINRSDIISRQINTVRQLNYSGIVFYSYKSIENKSESEHLKSEIEKIMGIL